ncbi:MAG: lytic transglycosylase domain-containing protein [Betaproteobacteria bacterium AqS2]|uniref:Lytic transglycosylase domain-containing protein n=1 Tax=Candidatus Amphirhobacter heronislandensis TaxID=1732024 RepID=A0A930XY90_9GAMM|nr:lytic transglycosylase domain-containing protein [Betaproteobacteria bacterium AqS2]
MALLGASAPPPAAADRATIRPVLLLQDAVRLADGRRQDAGMLRELAAGSPSAWVRHEAARELADYLARRGEWSEYQGVAGHASACGLLLRALYEGNRERIAAATGPALLGDPRDQTCLAALQRASAAGFLSDRDVWRRIRGLIEERKTRDAQRLLGLLKEDRASAATLRNAVNNATSRLLGPRIELRQRVDQELLAVSALVAAIYSRSPKKIGQVSAGLAEYAPRLDADLAAHLWPYIGKWHALNFSYAGAMDAFGRAPLAEHGRYALAWRTRAALRLGDWDEVVRTIETMQGEQRTLSAWRYWHAQAHHELGSRQRARRLMLGVARDFDDYYGLLAKESVGGMQVATATRRPRAALMDKLRDDVDVRMAIALGRDGKTVEARKIWKFLLRRLGDPEVLALAALAAEEGWYLGSINAADAVKADASDHEQRFPTPAAFAAAVADRAAKDGVPPELVYAIIRQESRFNAKAVSSAGARGLMQVMPRTARLVANKHKFTRYSLPRLTLIEPNVTIGVRYMADLYKNYGGDFVRLSAAYNAGPTNLRRWLRRSEGVDRKVFIETIPFTETRLYVKFVLANAVHYAWRLGRDEPRLAPLVAGSY